MDRSFLYGIIVLLALTDLVIYIQKTDPNLISKFVPSLSENNGWQSKDPGWNVKPETEKKPEVPEIKDKPEEKKDVTPNDDNNQNEPRKRHFKFFR